MHIPDEKRVLVVGLDSAPPELVFDLWRDDLPHLAALMKRGTYGRLKSTVPPITVPAWTAMMSGLDPGTLGFYGFRNRSSYQYSGMQITNSVAVQHPRVWDVLSENGRRVVVMNVPQTYPPRAVNGLMVSGFLAPDTTCEYTYPPTFKNELDTVCGGYEIDVDDFRTDDKAKLLESIYRITRKRFKAARHMLLRHPWDFFMMVEMGTDRIQHGFWKYHDAKHRKHDPKSPFRDAIKRYYMHLDKEIGRMLAIAGPRTNVLVVSDHGAQRMEGGLCINEWLISRGYLTLKAKPDKPRRLTFEDIDWSRTVAWGEGGYYSRVFLNVAGREPSGTVASSDYEEMRAKLAREISEICDETGKCIGSVVYRPEEVYSQVNNIAPDLIVYPGNLAWRSISSIGLGSYITYDNDSGPDDANHGEYGIFIAAGADVPSMGQIPAPQIFDVAPTVLKMMNVSHNLAMQGKPIF